MTLILAENIQSVGRYSKATGDKNVRYAQRSEDLYGFIGKVVMLEGWVNNPNYGVEMLDQVKRLMDSKYIEIETVRLDKAVH